MPHLTRRRFVQGSLAAAALSATPWPSRAATKRPKLPVAAIVTEYRENSHADVIVGKILQGFQQDGGAGPDLELVSMYTDQVPASDQSRGLAQTHGFTIYPTIDQAITLGTDKVAVAGVLSIGEHGDYPVTPDTKQKMYPRRRFFDEIAGTFRRCGRAVPVFNDKHLGFAWADAKYMVDTARELDFAFMAGSSLPVAWRSPPLTLPAGAPIREALAIGYSDLEAYGFHAVETLQCIIERRAGGETGVASVQAVQGDGILQAERDGRWSRKLFEAALATIPNTSPDRFEERLTPDAAFYLIEYKDGTRGTVAMANGVAAEFAFAATIDGQAAPVATRFWLQDWEPFGHFAHQLQAIEEMIHTGKASYPAERTLLTTGILDRAIHSLVAGQARYETPELAEVAYPTVDWPYAEGTPAPPRG